MSHRTRQTVENQYRQYVDLLRKSAPTILERYPTVERIEIEYTTERMSADAALFGTSRSQPETLTLGPDDPTFIHESCAMSGQPEGCVSGRDHLSGYNLTDVVQQAVSARRTEDSGRVSCPAWQDRTRVGQQPCAMVLKYKLRVLYRQM
jgi:hypothetical protein